MAEVDKSIGLLQSTHHQLIEM